MLTLSPAGKRLDEKYLKPPIKKREDVEVKEELEERF
jgi:hypothetical protein